jgi:hypothetical protein
MVPPNREIILSSQGQRASKNNDYYLKLEEDQSRKLKLILSQDVLCLNVNYGPNVNLKIAKKTNHTEEEKHFFKNKIKVKKKTEMCKNWQLYKGCFFKDNCSFAHGENELRSKNIEQNDKYKTKKCKAFLVKMTCQFGNRCQYRHEYTKPSLLSYNIINKKIAKAILIETAKETRNIDLPQIIFNYVMTNSIEK